jgi:uroporphyrinogen III methyltransferase/synthase
LLTLKGKAALQSAEVVFLDRLVNPGILGWAKKGAKVVDVGKEPGGKRTEQSVIIGKLIAAAKSGRQVVRLKGGDPFVFGRGGEEAEELAKAGVPFEVIPGVTAGVAAPAVAGIPVTHRGVSTELTFKVGARAEGSVSGRTLVGYMSVKGLAEFLGRAQEMGFDPETPAAMISRGTSRGQQTVISNVGRLAGAVQKAGLVAPAVVVVGGVVSLRKWVGKQAQGRLAGQRVVLTMSRALGQGWREIFEKEGAEVWELPMAEIRHLKTKASWAGEIAEAKWLVLTSGAGVRSLPKIVGDLRKLAGKRIAVLGKTTAAILRSIGLKADWVGPGPGAEALAGSWPGERKDRVLHITGTAEDGKLTRILHQRGFRAARIEAYENRQPVRPAKVILKALQNEGADWVVFASGTAAERFRRLVPQWIKEPRVAVIGPTTARIARRSGWRVKTMASAPSCHAILAGILQLRS